MALKALNSVAGFSVGEVPANVIYGNGDITAANLIVNAKSNLNSVSNVIITGGSPGYLLSTDGSGNLSFIAPPSTTGITNGTSNVSIPQLNGNITLNVNGTANVGLFTQTSLDMQGNVNPALANTYQLGNATNRWNNVFANTANIAGNIAAGGLLTNNLYYANGNPWDLQEAAGANYEIQYNIDDNFAASANFTYNDTTQLFTVLGNSQFNNANLGNLAIANFVNVASNITTSNLTVNLELAGNTANFSGNIKTLNANLGNLVTANFANIASNTITSNLTVNLELSGNTANFSGNLTTLNANLGNLATANFANIASNTITSNLTVNLELAGNTANFSGNIKALNANLGNLATSNFANIASNTITNNLTVNLELAGNTANFSGNITTLNANLGNIATANYVNAAINTTTGNLTVNLELSGNTANFTGNIKSLNANLGNLANANFVSVSSNTITSNLTVNLELAGNTANFSGNITTLNANLGNLANANFVSVSSNTLTNNLSVNLELAGNTANFTGNVVAGNLIGTFANGNSNVRIYNNANIEFSAIGTSNVVTISNTGLYVVGEINTTAGNMLSNGNVTANGFLNSANANVTGEALLGSVKTATITAPSGAITINAAGSNQNIVLVPTGTGVVNVSGKKISSLATPTNPTDAATKEYVDALAGEGLDIHTPVRVESPSNLNATYAQGGTTPTVDSISSNKIIDFGSAHGLSVNDGIVFTNSFNGITGGEAYWVFDVPTSTSITIKDGYFGTEITTLTNGTSLAQPSRANPGVGATLTNAGANAALQIDGVTLSSTNRVLVYSQTNAYENGVYVVTTVGAPDSPGPGSQWVLTRATDFNKYIPDSSLGLSKGSYVFILEGTTGAGESYVMTQPIGEVIIGTDNITFTQFSAASSYTAGSGIDIQGTVISANTDGVTTAISGGNIVVKASANLTTPNIGDATFQSVTWNNSGNGNVTANNLSIGNLANVTGNLTVTGNIFVDKTVTANGNISAANFSTAGNIIVANITTNLEFSGNTANFTGNVNAQSWLTVANTANVGNLRTDNLLYANGQPWDLQQAAGSNTQIQYNDGSNNFGASANLAFDYANNKLNINGTANVSGSVLLGNATITTALTWNSTTTSSISANQTIASISTTGITGLEFLVKGVDSAGSGKYSVATVQAVTDGTSVDYSVFATVNLGGSTGTLAVNISGGFVRLQVTPASSNSTVWTTQVRYI